MFRALVFVFLLLVSCVAFAGDTQTYGKYLVNHPTIKGQLLATNRYRAHVGLPPLTINPHLCLFAQRHASNMGHHFGYVHSGGPYSEVIHHGVRTPEDAVLGWINSPAHRTILYSGSEVGFGYANVNGWTYWVGVVR